MFNVKVHETGDGRLFVTVCDSEVLGTKLSEGELQLDLTSAYFRGKERDEAQAVAILRKAYSIIFAGNESVALGIMQGYVDEKNVLRISGVPTAQMMRV